MSVVVATRGRRASLLRSLARLDVPGGPPVVVVDNASADGTAGAVRAAHPRVEVVELPANAGRCGPPAGARRARRRLARPGRAGAAQPRAVWALQTRNDLLVDWLRRPLPVALAGPGRARGPVRRRAAALP